jgi:hypothetical protein
VEEHDTDSGLTTLASSRVLGGPHAEPLNTVVMIDELVWPSAIQKVSDTHDTALRLLSSGLGAAAVQVVPLNTKEVVPPTARQNVAETQEIPLRSAPGPICVDVPHWPLLLGALDVGADAGEFPPEALDAELRALDARGDPPELHDESKPQPRRRTNPATIHRSGPLLPIGMFKSLSIT